MDNELFLFYVSGRRRRRSADRRPFDVFNVFYVRLSCTTSIYKRDILLHMYYSR